MRDAFLIKKSSDSHKTQSQTKTNIDIIYLHFRKAFDTVQHNYFLCTASLFAFKNDGIG